jgi:hypothetical protein
LFLIVPSLTWSQGTGNLYIVDGYNSRLRMVRSSGNITTVGGNGTGGYSGDGGLATSAQPLHPYGARVGSTGNLYIAEVLARYPPLTASFLERRFWQTSELPTILAERNPKMWPSLG